MKKALLSLAIVFLAMLGKTQVTKGNSLVGGSVSYHSTSYSEGDGNIGTFIFMPDAGYFFVDRFAAGIRASYTNISDEGDNYSDLLVGPFARYYFLPAAQKTNIFLEGNFLFGSEKFEGFESENKTQFGLAAGPAFFVNPHVAIEAAVNWQTLKYKNDEGRYNTFGVSVGFQIHLNCGNGKKGK